MVGRGNREGERVNRDAGMGNQKGMRNESGDLVKGEARSLQNLWV